MISKILSAGLTGINGYIVRVETDMSGGLPQWDIVGLPDTAVKESKERIRSAVKNSGYSIPPKKVVVNLAPADVKKEGAYLDLPIAMGLLAASEQLGEVNFDGCAFLGELSLDGTLRPIHGVLPMVISLYQAGVRRIFVPKDNAEEAAVVSGAEIFGIEDLSQLIMCLQGLKVIEPTYVNTDDLFAKAAECALDFADVKGQQNAKRALEVAAAGGHNLLLIGPPGSGKTMLAQRIPSILPDLTFDEALEVTKIHSIAGRLPSGMPMVLNRPFRSPHHTISSVGMSGGGTYPKPGEVSLSHNGVLFLDELPEFRKDTLEVLRQPLEDGFVTISRASGTFAYPCNIMMVASMNPCPCGYYGDSNHECTCPPNKISKYLNKVSGPLLDRIDLHVEVPAVQYDDLEYSGKAESSKEIKKRVNRAREIQNKRYKGTDIYSNSQLNAAMTEEFCKIGQAEHTMLRQAFEMLGLSARAHNRILKVARTIADLDGSENIKTEHIAEAIQYRSLDRKFWA